MRQTLGYGLRPNPTYAQASPPAAFLAAFALGGLLGRLPGGRPFLDGGFRLAGGFLLSSRLLAGALARRDLARHFCPDLLLDRGRGLLELLFARPEGARHAVQDDAGGGGSSGAERGAGDRFHRVRRAASNAFLRHVGFLAELCPMGTMLHRKGARVALSVAAQGLNPNPARRPRSVVRTTPHARSVRTAHKDR